MLLQVSLTLQLQYLFLFFFQAEANFISFFTLTLLLSVRTFPRRHSYGL
jgi:hypothetical protein